MRQRKASRARKNMIREEKATRNHLANISTDKEYYLLEEYLGITLSNSLHLFEEKKIVHRSV